MVLDDGVHQYHFSHPKYFVNKDSSHDVQWFNELYHQYLIQFILAFLRLNLLFLLLALQLKFDLNYDKQRYGTLLTS